jgi:prevent-host-death family protein
MTTKEVSVAEAKKHFSDLLGRVAYRGERITISKRGKPTAVLVPATEVRGQKGIREIRGWLEASHPFFKVIDQIVSDREKHLPRILDSTES